MTEYINKQELLKNFCGYDLTKCNKYGNETLEQQSKSHDTLMMYEIAWEIDDAPAADVRPERHGHWINEEPYTALNGTCKKSQTCSECNTVYISDGNTHYSNHKFCPECGAKMDGKVEWIKL